MQSEVSTLLVEAATLLLVGMSVVFVFLTMLLGAIHGIAKVNRLLPEEVTPTATTAKRPTPRASSSKSADANTLSPQIVAAISAAIHQHRNTR